jgi:cell division protein FtsW (lipid II flippase)
MVAQSIVVLLSILFSSALLLANDEKFMHGNPVNSGTVINLIGVGLTMNQLRELIRLITVPLLTGLPYIYFSSWAKSKADENKINNSTIIDWVAMHIFLVYFRRPYSWPMTRNVCMITQAIVVLLLILLSSA